MNDDTCTEWGFDLTDFGSKDQFQKVLSENELTEYEKIVVDKGSDIERFHYTWSNKEGSLTLITGNDPISGLYSAPRMRRLEVGYASYMGIRGSNKKEIMNLVNSVKEHATNIKGESECHRGFI